MSEHVATLDRIVTALVPSLSKSLAEQFNVFRVMHHGTHEKQLSNVFAWLLDAQATHELGDGFQRIFLERVNGKLLPPEPPLPPSGYRVSQEVDTSGEAAMGRDIADIVLRSDATSVVVENFGSSDGHGHDYDGYLAYGAAGGRQSVVVLLCGRHEPYRQRDGWEKAVVVTYAELLGDLRALIDRDKVWRKQHEKQRFFIEQLVDHFGEGPAVVSREDRIAFIKAMCETGESARYGHRPQEAAAQEFADQVAQHARHQFDEGRETLLEVKRSLKHYAEHTLKAQINDVQGKECIAVVKARYVGQWEWYVVLDAPDSSVVAGLVFGPTAATYNGTVPRPLVDPDFSKVFVIIEAVASATGERLDQTEVGIEEVLAGLSADDTRLRDAVIAAASLGQAPR